jgi:hypothetical protein
MLLTLLHGPQVHAEATAQFTIRGVSIVAAANMLIVY